jgi:hypothetical protein
MNIWKAFPERKEYEQLVYVLRADLIVLVGPVFLLAILGVVPFVLQYIFSLVAPGVLENQPGLVAFTLFRGVYWLFILVFGLTEFFDYYLDVWIVTNERIVDIQLKGLFARAISETRLYRVQDVTAQMKGVFATLFDYGTVHVQTAGATGRFTFEQMPDPDEVVRNISKLIEDDKPFHAEKIATIEKEVGIAR